MIARASLPRHGLMSVLWPSRLVRAAAAVALGYLSVLLLLAVLGQSEATAMNPDTLRMLRRLGLVWAGGVPLLIGAVIGDCTEGVRLYPMLNRQPGVHRSLARSAVVAGAGSALLAGLCLAGLEAAGGWTFAAEYTPKLGWLAALAISMLGLAVGAWSLVDGAGLWLRCCALFALPLCIEPAAASLAESSGLALALIGTALAAVWLRFRPSRRWGAGEGHARLFYCFHAPRNQMQRARSAEEPGGEWVQIPQRLHASLAGLRAARRFEIRAIQRGKHMLRLPLTVAFVSVVSLSVADLFFLVFRFEGDGPSYVSRWAALLLGPKQGELDVRIEEWSSVGRSVIGVQIAWWGMLFASGCCRPLLSKYPYPWSRRTQCRLVWSLVIRGALQFSAGVALFGMTFAWALVLASGAVVPPGIPHTLAYSALVLVLYPVYAVLYLRLFGGRSEQQMGLRLPVVASIVGLGSSLVFFSVVQTMAEWSRASATVWVSVGILTLLGFGLLRWQLQRHYLRSDLV